MTLAPSEPTMRLYSGKNFSPLSAQPEDIEVQDIAHALGMTCRYGGHCTKFYSVAEHSVLLSHRVDPAHALWALLHDASEAYIGDMIRPLKREIPAFVEVEDRLEACIAARFGLPWPMPEQVREYDTRIAIDEMVQIMAPFRHPTTLEGYAPLGLTIFGWDPAQAEERFLDRYYTLTEN